MDAVYVDALISSDQGASCRTTLVLPLSLMPVWLWGRGALQAPPGFLSVHNMCNCCRASGVLLECVMLTWAAVAAERLREAGVAHVVYWDAAAPPGPNGALAAACFGHAFAAMLRNATSTVPEARSFSGQCLTACAPHMRMSSVQVQQTGPPHN